jgi:hypothetical protein
MTLHDAEKLLEELENLFVGHDERLLDRVSELKNFVVDKFRWIPVEEIEKLKADKAELLDMLKEISKGIDLLGLVDIFLTESMNDLIKKMEDKT